MTRVRRTHTLASVLGATLSLLVAALIVPSSASAYNGPEPREPADRMVLSISTPGVAVPRTPGSRGVAFVAAGTSFSVTASFYDDDGRREPLSFHHDRWLTIRAGTCPGGTRLGSAFVRHGRTSATVPGLRLGAANDVRLCASAPGWRHALRISRTSTSFDVVKEFTHAAPTQALTQVGGTAAAGGCTPTRARPVCADLRLPKVGGVSDPAGILMALGLCTGISQCSGSFLQALVGLDPAVYTLRSPAMLVMKCDKTMCGTGGVRQQHLAFNLAPGSRVTTAPACARKGIVGPHQKLCVDYVQSHRSGSGDTWLYVLFTEDLRIHFL
jgi:hypothetical protein